MRQRPIASICCSPPDSVPADCPPAPDLPRPPPRRPPRRLPAPLGEPREQREYPLAILRALPPGARQHGADLEILVDAERGEDLTALRALAEAKMAHAVARQAADLGSAEPDAAASRTMHAGDGLDQRSLAGAIGAHDGGARSLVDRERNPGERLRVAGERGGL